MAWLAVIGETAPPPIANAVVADPSSAVPVAVVPAAGRTNQTASAAVADAAAAPTTGAHVNLGPSRQSASSQSPSGVVPKSSAISRGAPPNHPAPSLGSGAARYATAPILPLSTEPAIHSIDDVLVNSSRLFNCETARENP